MKLEFFGAAAEVTGSCHILQVGGKRVLLDCGLIQGSRKDEARNADPFPFDAAQIDAVCAKVHKALARYGDAANYEPGSIL